MLIFEYMKYYEQMPGGRDSEELKANDNSADDLLEDEPTQMEIFRELYLKLKEALKKSVSIFPREVMGAKTFKYLREKGMDESRLDLYEEEQAEEWLRKNNLLGENCNGPNAILVFNFPKPISYWWKKGKPDGLQPGVYAEGAPDKWGEMYANKIEFVWFLRDLMSKGGIEENKVNKLLSTGVPIELLEDIEEKAGSFESELVRMNALGEHDHKNYYYVWGQYF